MSRLENRSQLMAYLGATQRNAVWSWCAVDEENKKVYLSVWTDTSKKRDGKRVSYLIQEPYWGIDENTSARSPARNDHDEKLSMIFDEGYEAYGYFIEAKDTTADPREIESTKTSFIFELELERLDDGSIIGYPLRRIEIR
jgi:hypothetical protein